MSIYNDMLIDDASHEHVVGARRQGRAWAEREAEAAYPLPLGDWAASDTDAYALVEFPPNSEVQDQYEREAELRAICNASAKTRWYQLVGEYAAATADKEET